VEGPDDVAAELDAAFDHAGSAPVSCWNREELAAWMRALDVYRARLDALCIDAAAAATTAGVATLAPGARTLRQFVGATSNAHTAQVAGDQRLAQWLVRFPSVAAALRAGRISRRHVEAIRDLENPRTVAALRAHEEVLVEAAASCTWDGFREVCGRLLVYADHDGSLADERVRRRGVSVRTHHDGMVTGTFCLEPISGAAFKAALERELRRLTELDADPAQPTAAHRDARQRMADALVNLVARGALRSDATVGAPLVHVVVGEEVLEEAMHRAAAADEGVVPVGPDGEPLDDDLRVDPADPLRRCELVDGTPIHPSTVVGLLGVATLRRLVLGATGEVLDLGRSVRTFPRHLKDALLVAARGRCSTSGCDAPPGWLEADHVIPWSRGGPTATHNGQILCAADNRAKRDGVRPRSSHDHEPSEPRRAGVVAHQSASPPRAGRPAEGRGSPGGRVSGTPPGEGRNPGGVSMEHNLRSPRKGPVGAR
jgi:hypothetical protein